MFAAFGTTPRSIQTAKSIVEVLAKIIIGETTSLSQITHPGFEKVGKIVSGPPTGWVIDKYTEVSGTQASVTLSQPNLNKAGSRKVFFFEVSILNAAYQHHNFKYEYTPDSLQPSKKYSETIPAHVGSRFDWIISASPKHLMISTRPRFSQSYNGHGLFIFVTDISLEEDPVLKATATHPEFIGSVLIATVANNTPIGDLALRFYGPSVPNYDHASLTPNSKPLPVAAQWNILSTLGGYRSTFKVQGAQLHWMNAMDCFTIFPEGADRPTDDLVAAHPLYMTFGQNTIIDSTRQGYVQVRYSDLTKVTGIYLMYLKVGGYKGNPFFFDQFGKRVMIKGKPYVAAGKCGQHTLFVPEE